MKISVITAAYNSARTIEDTLLSVLHQTYAEIEYIVVDGGSTDGTMDIVRKYEPRFYGRLKWISEPDRGIYDAMNKGIKMATGDVVGILNSDDYYTRDDVVSSLTLFFEDGNVDAVYGDVHFVKASQPDNCVRYYSSKQFRPMWLRFGFMPAHPSFYLRRSVYQQAGGYKLDYQIGADYEMMVRLFYTHRIHAKYVPMDFVTMRTGGASTRNLQSRLTLIKEDVKACRENGVYTNRVMICTKFVYKLFGLKP
jgi:glycosyltransferase involved in cell wall biosynthesis